MTSNLLNEKSTMLAATNAHPALHVRYQPTTRDSIASALMPDVIYVHGSTFPSELSIFFKFDNQSWADSINQAGLNVWGFDFAGYGNSARYDESHFASPLGRLDQAAPQLESVIDFVYSANSGNPVALVAHSWGCLAALRVATTRRQQVAQLVLFGPIAPRKQNSSEAVANQLPATQRFNIWEQYRRFIGDVPKDHAPVLLDHHFERWAEAYLATDKESGQRTPRSVCVPAGPIVDLVATWNGAQLYEGHTVTQRTLLVRGEWDSVCDDTDAAVLLDLLGAKDKQDVKIPKGTHLMHLEESRHELHEVVNQFLSGTAS
jgi:pimeloyl-ACP methyl ester carboxylesterase